MFIEYVTDSLTRAGRREAAALARYFASDDCEARPTRIYSSPRGRARATARYSEKALEIRAEIEPWTTELTHWPRMSGGGGEDSMRNAKPGEGGLAIWDTAGEESQIRDVADIVNVGNQFEVTPSLKVVQTSYGELKACSDMFIARHGYVWETPVDGAAGRYRVVQSNDEVIAVFCHGGFGLTWLAILLGLPLTLVYTSFYLAPSSVTTILFDERSADFACPRLLNFGSLAHLEKEGLCLRASKYERPNKYKRIPGATNRVSGVKSNFF